MGVYLGRNARIKLGTVTIARMTDFDFSYENATEEVTGFGDDAVKVVRTMRSWSGSSTGKFDESDVAQIELREKCEDGDLITNLRFYVDSTAYYAANVIEQAADPDIVGCYGGWDVSAPHNGVITVTIALTGSGSLTRYPL